MRVEFSFPAQTTHLRVVRAIVSELTALCTTDANEIAWMVQAADEAISNVVDHAYRGRTDGTVIVVCEARDGELEFRVTDRGQSFAFDPKAPFDLEAYIAAGKGRGLGLHMIRRVADHLEYSSKDGANVLVIRRRLRGSSGEGAAGPGGVHGR